MTRTSVRFSIGAWVVLSAFAYNVAPAQDYNGWIGKKAMERDNTTFVLKIGNQIVASGDQSRLYTIERTNGAWLWLMSGSLKGWAPASEVVLLDDAPQYYTDYIRSHPDDLRWGYQRRAITWYYKGEYDLAIADCGEAIRQDPSMNHGYARRALCYMKKQDYDHAISDLNEALRIDPNDASAYHDRGEAYFEKGDYDRALADCNQSIRADPSDGWGYCLRGRTWQAKKEYDKAVADFASAMRLNPNEGEFVYHRGWAYHLKGQNEEAVKDLNEAIRLDPKWPGYLIDRGIILAEGLHDLERGITDYDKAINLDPKRESTYRYRAYAKRLAHDYDQAIADYSTALELDPKSASAVEGRGLAKLLKGAHQEAAIDFARTVELAPPKDTVASYGAILEFEALQLNGEPDQAKAHLDAATPRLDSSRWPYQIIRYLRGEIDQDALNAAATDNNKQTEVHCYIGYEALIKGDKEKAVEQFRWVKDHGTRSFLEHELAVVELNRLAN